MTQMAYIGRMKCGCVTAVCIDTGTSDVGSFVKELIDDGYTVERVTVEESRKLLVCECVHKRKAN